MATGVVTARGLVSELVDCHAHDTVSAMSYRDRSEGHAFACLLPEAIEIIFNLIVPIFSGIPAIIVILVTNFGFDRISHLNAGLVISFIVNLCVPDH